MRCSLDVLFIFLDVSTDEESLDSPTCGEHGECSSSSCSEQPKKKYVMRTRRSLDQDKKREEKLITAELKLKYGTYIDLIPDLKDLPYFELLFVDREKSSRPSVSRVQENIRSASPRRFPLPYSNNSSMSKPSPVALNKSENRLNTLKRSWSSSNVSEASLSSVENSDTEEDSNFHQRHNRGRRHSIVRREFTSTVSSESLKLTIKLKPSPVKRERYFSSSSSEHSEASSVRSTSSISTRQQQQQQLQKEQKQLQQNCNRPKGTRSSARLRSIVPQKDHRVATSKTPQHNKHRHQHHHSHSRHHHHHMSSTLVSKRNRIIIQKKCDCCI